VSLPRPPFTSVRHTGQSGPHARTHLRLLAGLHHLDALLLQRLQVRRQLLHRLLVRLQLRLQATHRLLALLQVAAGVKEEEEEEEEEAERRRRRRRGERSGRGRPTRVVSQSERGGTGAMGFPPSLSPRRHLDGHLGLGDGRGAVVQLPVDLVQPVPLGLQLVAVDVHDERVQPRHLGLHLPRLAGRRLVVCRRRQGRVNPQAWISGAG